jgi:hypothetical protein
MCCFVAAFHVLSTLKFSKAANEPGRRCVLHVLQVSQNAVPVLESFQMCMLLVWCAALSARAACLGDESFCECECLSFAHVRLCTPIKTPHPRLEQQAPHRSHSECVCKRCRCIMTSSSCHTHPCKSWFRSTGMRLCWLSVLRAPFKLLMRMAFRRRCPLCSWRPLLAQIQRLSATYHLQKKFQFGMACPAL